MILDQIAATVRRGLSERKQELPLADLKHLTDSCDSPRDFGSALSGENIKLIAEVKRASPSKGWICADLNVTSLVRGCSRGGAAAISVLTEPDWFKGSLEDLATARRATNLPLLCKDFFMDPYQVFEARVSGADAILLITALLSQGELSELMEVSHSLGMMSLVEVHSAEEIERALEVKAKIIGINNRNLADFSVDLTTTVKLRPLVPSDIIVVSESGIRSYADVFALQLAGINAALVGEALTSHPNPEAKLRELRGER